MPTPDGRRIVMPVEPRKQPAAKPPGPSIPNPLSLLPRSWSRTLRKRLGNFTLEAEATFDRTDY